MSNKIYNYYDQEYNPEHADGNELLIIIAGDVFSFAIVHKEDHKLLVWGDKFDLNELAEPDELKTILSASYSSRKIAVQSTDFTIVHQDLFTNDQLAGYSRFLTHQPGGGILVNKIEASNYVVFAVNQKVLKSIGRMFDLTDILFAGKAWIASINFARLHTQPLYVHVAGNVLHLLYYKDSDFNFYNTFEFNNPDELMYFIILTANELNLNLDATSVILSGDISVADERIQRVMALLPKVYFNQNQIVTLPLGFISHQFLMLAGLMLCGSSVGD